MKYKKFKTPNGQSPVRVALLSGHVTIIPNDKFVSLPEFFWAESYAAGAISEDMTESKTVEEVNREEIEKVTRDREEFYEKLKESLREIYSKPTGKVDRNGFPVYKQVVALVKKPVKKELIEKAWKEVILENETDE